MEQGDIMSTEEIRDDEFIPGQPDIPVKSKAFEDPSGQYPKGEYSNSVTTNKAATGTEVNTLYYGGGDQGIDLELDKLSGSLYPRNQVRKTERGHVTEFDDTPNNERILIKHRTGAGVEVRPDGTVIVSSINNRIEVVGGSHKVIVEGDAEIAYKGNMSLNVSGDLDLNIGGNYNIKVAGDKVETIDGSHKQRIYRNRDVMTLKNEVVNTVGSRTEFVFGDQTLITKGYLHEYIQKEVHRFGGEKIYTTAEDEYIISSPNINITASNLSVLGDSGTIGGENIVNYFYTSYGVSSTYTAGVTAPTFHGDLNGTAERSNSTSSQNYGEAATAGAAYDYTEIATDTTATALPTPTLITDLLANPENKQVKDMEIDAADSIQQGWDKTFDYGGVFYRPMSTEEIRSRLRDPNNAKNNRFVGAQIVENKLSPSFSIIAPPAIGRSATINSVQRGKTKIGNNSKGSSKLFKR